MTYRNLLSLPIGASSVVRALYVSGPMRRRLLDIGLTQNAPVCCLFQSAAGDPRAYLIRGAVIALRNEEAKQIEIL